MGRPRYESTQDLVNERRVAGAIALLKLWQFTKLSENNYGLDWVFWTKAGEIPGMKGKIEMLAEVKCRTTKHDDFSHYMISLSKVRRLRACVEENIKAFLFVEFTDGLYCVPGDTPYELGVGMRHPPRDEHDTEPMAFIGMSYFRRVNGIDIEAREAAEG